MKRILALLAAAVVLLSAAGCAGEDERVPEEYYKDLPSSGSRVERITYTSHDYYYDSSREIKKHALVYLPADYSEETPCEVLILCHGLTGTETAVALAMEGKDVTLIDKLSTEEIDANGLGSRSVAGVLRGKGAEAGVKVITGLTAKQFFDNLLVAENEKGERVELPFDTAVLSMGVRGLADEARKFDRLAPNVVYVGDCMVKAGNIMSAVLDGFYAAVNI